MSNSTLSESRAPLYIAQDLKLFEKYGLDAQIVNIRGSAINNAALMAGEIQMAVANGTIAITAAARGAPIVIVGDHRADALQPGVALAHFGRAAEGQNHRYRRLRHRRLQCLAPVVAETRPDPEKDVTLLPTGTTSSFERINMMLSGKADAVLATKSNIDQG